MKKHLKYKDYIILLPFLFFYVLIIFFKQQNVLLGDEGRYWSYAYKLLQGYYAGSEFGEYSYLWNGPGYPIILMPFRYYDTPLIYPKLMNAFFLYAGLIFFFRSLKHFLIRKKALWVTITLGFYYPLLQMALPALYTEALSFMCCTAFIYFFFNYYKEGKTQQFILCCFSLAYLALTKVIFGYVILTLLVCFLIWYFFSKAKKEVISFIKILVCSLVICSPYLLYTYSLTDKFFYWGNSGGMNLYWMSSPFEGELGDWHYFETLEEEFPEIYKNHESFLLSIKNLTPVEKDTALKQKAVENIINHKQKFIKNWVSNISRIFIEIPYSYRVQSNNQLFYLLPNVTLIMILISALLISILNFRMFSNNILFLILFIIIYLGGISVLSALVRFLYPIIPILLMWICYTFEKFVKINRERGRIILCISNSIFSNK
ncbi:glycosyltransferase family 39 protein [Aquimarina sp. RZ0]|uniref:ArnT family glycosyltransferase n=1 Tax=Aquimarina sp. RZ0 TaxID=2607730 RepID=UPI0011F12F3E|nr:hypothetical protein [Aquimarina sp. RZ0]KAA1242608.1 hypothetical protein F0000_24845 [Aquimarina sp. RZ0]